MDNKKRNNRRPLIAGGVLFLLFIAGLMAVGAGINHAATTMSRHVVSQIGDSHFRLLDNELRRTEQHFALLRSYLETTAEVTHREWELLTSGIMGIDPTIDDISLREAAHPRPATAGDSLRWISTESAVTASGHRYLIYIERPLHRLHAYLSEIEPIRRSYAVVFDTAGRIIYHPEAEELGRRVDIPHQILENDAVAEDFERRITLPFDDYLGLEQDHIFYPLPLSDGKWTAMIGIPTIAIQHEIEEFHIYTLFIAFFSVVLFALLLLYTQRRWRREYDLRRQSQTEFHRMQLQRVMDRIDPHFLFNSLNSLYVLIRTDARLAREFTLSLSKVYRHVLERREQNISTLADELELCSEYYKLQKIRFGGNVSLTTDIDPRLMTCHIPAMTLQTLVENAVKHNSITPATPLFIRIAAQGDHLTVENNLTPRDEEDDSLGVGLESIRSIYRFYTDRAVEITADDRHFVCRLPLF